MAAAVRQILFGYHPVWTPKISNMIDTTRFQPSFAPLNAVHRDRFDAIVPVKLADYKALAGSETGERRNVLFPRAQAVELCHDKLAFARWMIEAGFAANIPPVFEEAPAGPSIRKPRRSAWGIGCTLVDDGDKPAADDEHFFQAVIEGHDEFACSLIRRGDQFRYVLGVHYRMKGDREIRSASAKPKLMEMIDASAELPLFARVLRALDYEGTCSFNYKFADGVPMILEINPRFGASIVFDINRYVESYLASLVD